MTAILQLPTLSVSYTTKTNEDWCDSFAFATAGAITGYAAIGNVGVGGLAAMSISAGAYIGDYILTMTGATTFRVVDPDGYTIGAGIAGLPFSASGINFTLSAGNPAFAVGDSYIFNVLPQPIDVSGIRFLMQVRAATPEGQPPSPQILVQGDTDDGTIINGGSTGVLSFSIPASAMEKVPVSPAGSPHVLDILAIADGRQRCCAEATCTVKFGYTYPTAT